MTPDQKLGQHFILREFLRSATAARAGLEIPVPPNEILTNLERLVEEVLDPLRADIRRPIAVLSGWRPPWLNKMVGGAPGSEHMHGRAADLIVAGRDNRWVCRRIESLALPFRQLILEFPPGGWVHVSIPAIGLPPDRRSMTAARRGGRTEYTLGIAV